MRKRYKKQCGICSNAYCNHKLDPKCDLSYTPVGNCSEGYRILVSSGGERPTKLMVEHLDISLGQWVTVGVYTPKYCPECGRELIENE